MSGECVDQIEGVCIEDGGGPFVVTPGVPASPPDVDQLADTGVDGGWFVAVAITMVAIGMLLRAVVVR